MKKKHIAMFISSLNKGGSERVLVNLAEYFYSRGYRVTIVTQYKTENEYGISDGIRRVFSEITQEEMGNGRISNFLRRFSKLRRIWKEERPDLILSFIGKNNMMAVMTSRFLGIPTVVSVRGEPAAEYDSGMMKIIANILFRLADAVVLPVGRGGDFFSKAVRKKAVCLKNPLHPAFIREVYEGERDKEIVAVGRIDANKNHEMIIRAFGGIAGKYPEYRLVIYGEGELRHSLTEMAKDMGLEDRVFLPGSVSDVADKIYKSSIFVLSSYSEGMPNTLIEAMALGIPSISTDCPCGGPAELIEDGKNGYLIAPGDWKKLQDILQRLMDNPDLAKEIGRNASKMQEKLNPDTINRMWENYVKDWIRK
jgi:GalNAc-alpha-(1->4)-GalNAc-alpha-(1->3)-diNAcBac-PP-undecaprenol alpha-1,4-N-acetyl-D-galactosaminyltransferase